jgi:hypothetical protein
MCDENVSNSVISESVEVVASQYAETVNAAALVCVLAPHHMRRDTRTFPNRAYASSSAKPSAVPVPSLAWERTQACCPRLAWSFQWELALASCNAPTVPVDPVFVGEMEAGSCLCPAARSLVPAGQKMPHPGTSRGLPSMYGHAIRGRQVGLCGPGRFECTGLGREERSRARAFSGHSRVARVTELRDGHPPTTVCALCGPQHCQGIPAAERHALGQADENQSISYTPTHGMYSRSGFQGLC